jgi:alkyl sulfatase BDS1-like metallo-beta-lactamase superfamily hydrolase
MVGARLFGTLRHNAKAVYQKYLGWYDGDPADFDPLPPVENARKTIEYMGGAEAVIARARADFAKGEYRWVATAMNQLVFADPANRAARELGADALEQLGFQAETGTWRNAYLVGAMELRNGPPKIPGGSTVNAETLHAISNGQLFDYLGPRLNADKAEGKTLLIDWNFTDSNQPLALTLEKFGADPCPGQALGQRRRNRNPGARRPRSDHPAADDVFRRGQGRPGRNQRRCGKTR